MLLAHVDVFLERLCAFRHIVAGDDISPTPPDQGGDVPFGEHIRQTIQTLGMLAPLPGLRIKFGYTLWKLEVS